MKHAKHSSRKTEKLSDNWFIVLLLALLYLIVALAFYLALVVGVIVIIAAFFMENAHTIPTIGIGIGVIAITLFANLCAVRIARGRWRLHWPDLSFLWQLGSF